MSNKKAKTGSDTKKKGETLPSAALPASLTEVEEDDEFEEFENEWTEKDLDDDKKIKWEEDWDDEQEEEDFSKQLKQELEKAKSGSAPMQT